MTEDTAKVNTLVLDAGPLITQPAIGLQQLAHSFYTTPGVYNELRDERVRSQLPIWSDRLQVRQPRASSIKAISDFAKLTGDYAVLSMNDVHLMALTYELECELNNGDGRLRKYPGGKRNNEVEEKEDNKDGNKTIESNGVEEKPTEDDGWTTVRKAVPKKVSKKKGENHNKKSTSKKVDSTVGSEKDSAGEATVESISNSKPSNDDDDDDGDWITPDNLIETMMKNKNESIETDKVSVEKMKVAIATGDFAIQNVSLQIGLNLINAMSGMRIKRVRNYMYRCHACFTLTPMPKDGTPKHFCPNCGGATLMRCTVSVDSKTGEVKPFLKKNFEWHTKGNVYSIPSPLSKNSAKRYGRKGYQHRGNPNIEDLFLREDQKEYQQALKNAEWQRRQNEKAMDDFVGGGSADNIVSPFLAGNGLRPVKVFVGKGKNANAPRKQRK
ncbi:hypothetical protein FOA43_003813 [Brettanomyces nanus]|uniref:20S-pre-rRNA D-site endonuclease NOB1 n=1 Tax=Eeniella nana TaxID=13502 RepID=A0A875SC86_EENNA|nr:uncharacterized protein FOA43_003813 [Brettanomyces nanus]QPG76424.1 hypothetical protein FOA43_003813 [Brettanomyces nanus]